MGHNSDKELLELAAKAAGIEIKGWAFDKPYTKCWSQSGNGYSSFDAEYWNPITNTVDRYRLIAELKLGIDFTECTVWKRLLDGTLIQEFWGGECGDEAHAVLRVAAAIGKEKP